MPITIRLPTAKTLNFAAYFLPFSVPCSSTKSRRVAWRNAEINIQIPKAVSIYPSIFILKPPFLIIAETILFSSVVRRTAFFQGQGLALSSQFDLLRHGCALLMVLYAHRHKNRHDPAHRPGVPPRVPRARNG